MATAIIASIAPTLAALAAWYSARRDPAGLARIEARCEELMDWTVKHERRHYRMEGDQR